MRSQPVDPSDSIHTFFVWSANRWVSRADSGPREHFEWSESCSENAVGSNIYGVHSLNDDCIDEYIPPPRSRGNLPFFVHHNGASFKPNVLFCPIIQRVETLNCYPEGKSLDMNSREANTYPWNFFFPTAMSLKTHVLTLGLFLHHGDMSLVQF